MKAPDVLSAAFSDFMGGDEQPQESPLIRKLRQLQRLGDPIEVADFPQYDNDRLLHLRTDSPASVELELHKDMLAEELLWYDVAQIIGCLVSYLLERGEQRRASELYAVSKDGLSAVLDTRLQQLRAHLQA